MLGFNPEGVFLNYEYGRRGAKSPQRYIMKRLNLLLANMDRRTNNLIEAAVLDACFNQAAVQCTRTGRVDEMVHYGGHPAVQLIVVSPANLVAAPSRKGAPVTIEEVGGAIRSIKEHCATPVIVVNVPAAEELGLRQAGADVVMEGPFDREMLKAEVRQVLNLREPETAEPPARWSLAALFGRGLHRLRNA
jgi:hypothetical protein